MKKSVKQTLWALCGALVLVLAILLFGGFEWTFHPDWVAAQTKEIRICRLVIRLEMKVDKELAKKAYKLKAGRLTDSEFDFMLDFPGLPGVPVIKVRYDDLTMYFMVDTGAPMNILFRNGDFSSINDISDKGINWPLYDKNGTQLPMYWPDDMEYSEIAVAGSITEMPVLAGILGLPWMQLHDNVVFDYQEQKLLFDQKPLSSNRMNMFLADGYHWWIEYTVDAVPEIGIIDTGCSWYVVRKNIGDGAEYTNIDDVVWWMQNGSFGKVPSFFPVHVPNIRIGNYTAGSKHGLRANYYKMVNADNTRRFCSMYSCLGYAFWQDHAIQLDFKRQAFRHK